MGHLFSTVAAIGSFCPRPGSLGCRASYTTDDELLATSTTRALRLGIMTG